MQTTAMEFGGLCTEPVKRGMHRTPVPLPWAGSAHRRRFSTARSPIQRDQR